MPMRKARRIISKAIWSCDMLGEFVDNNEGRGYGASLELGRKIAR
jgi:hypothetical protein